MPERKIQDRLKPKEAKFIEHYVKHRNGSQAVIYAGYKTKNPKVRACQILQKPQVKEAIEEVMTEFRKKAQEDSVYGLEKAMKDIEFGLEFAKITHNANAFMKGLELKSKINGLIIDRHDVRTQANFSINILGIGGSKKLPVDVTPTVQITQGDSPKEETPAILAKNDAPEDES